MSTFYTFWENMIRYRTERVPIFVLMNSATKALKRRAQIALEVGKGQLADSFGNVLDAQTLIGDAKIENGASLTLHITPAQVRSSGGAFATILGDGSFATWGDDGRGGDCSDVQDQLKNAPQIQATCRAFAAILGNGSIATWGDDHSGGDSSAVQHQLKNVQQIQAAPSAFGSHSW